MPKASLALLLCGVFSLWLFSTSAEAADGGAVCGVGDASTPADAAALPPCPSPRDASVPDAGTQRDASIADAGPDASSPMPTTPGDGGLASQWPPRYTSTPPTRASSDPSQQPPPESWPAKSIPAASADDAGSSTPATDLEVSEDHEDCACRLGAVARGSSPWWMLLSLVTLSGLRRRRIV